MKNIYVLFLMLMFGHILFAQSASGERVYYYKGVRKVATERSERILLRLNENADSRTILNALQSNAQYRILRSDIRQGEYIVLEATAQSTALQRLKTLEDLRRTEGISSANFMLYKPESDHFLGYANRFIVKLHPSTSNSDFNALLNAYGCEVEYQGLYNSNIFYIRTTSFSTIDALQASAVFHASGLFEFSEPDFLQRSVLHTADPLFSEQWALNNTGQFGGTAGADIDIEGAWTFTRGRPDIRIALVDGGVELTHPDLQGSLVPGYDASGNGTNGGPVDGETHGTNCAGVIGAVADNNIGLAGIASECALVPVSFDVLDAFDSEVADAVNWAWDQGMADVMSNSWGRLEQSSIIEDAISNAALLGRNGLGCVVVFAAGNENLSEVAYLSDLPNVVCVAATDMCDRRWAPTDCSGNLTSGGSNRGVHLDVAAPGVRIQTTHNGGQYALFGGTSAASPIVSAIAGLILSVNPCLARAEVEKILQLSCDKPIYESSWTDELICYSLVSGRPNGTWNNELGHGRVNAYKAVKYALSNNIAVGNYHGGGSDGSNGDLFQWILLNNTCHSLAAAATYFVYRYEVYRNVSFPYTASPVIQGTSTGLSAANPNIGAEYTVVSNVTNTSARLSTFVYNIISASSGQSVGWIPHHPLDVDFHFFVTENVTPAVYLQNQIVSGGSHNYRSANFIWSGRNVTSAIPIGDYVVQGTAQVDLDARNNIDMFVGTVINPGSGGFFNAEVGPFFTCSQYPMGRAGAPSDQVRAYDQSRDFVQNENQPIIQEEGEVFLVPEVTLIPNPTQGQFQMLFTGMGDVLVQIISASGEEIRSFRTLSKGEQIDIKTCDPGLYLVKVTHDSGVITKKIIKQ